MNAKLEHRRARFDEQRQALLESLREPTAQQRVGARGQAEGYGVQISMTFISETAVVLTRRVFSGFQEFKEIKGARDAAGR